MVRVLLILGSLALTAPAVAQEEVGIAVTVAVIDQAGTPIPDAWVRVPNTEGRRRVEPATGQWTATSVLGSDGTEVPFKRGMFLDLTISAPGYSARTVQYEVAKRHNVVTVPLEPMDDPDYSDENDTELMIRWFQRTDFQDEQ